MEISNRLWRNKKKADMTIKAWFLWGEKHDWIQHYDVVCDIDFIYFGSIVA